MGYPTPSEPDRFLPWTNKPPRPPLVAADVPQGALQNMRACAVAAGMPQEVIDRMIRWCKPRGITFAWSTGTPDSVAASLSNFGYLFTRIGIPKGRASAFVRTFALFGAGNAGPVTTGLTVPATFKPPV